LGLAPETLRWGARNTRAIAAEKKQSYSPRGQILIETQMRSRTIEV
jgi:hypothetical protein